MIATRSQKTVKCKFVVRVYRFGKESKHNTCCTFSANMPNSLALFFLIDRQFRFIFWKVWWCHASFPQVSVWFSEKPKTQTVYFLKSRFLSLIFVNFHWYIEILFSFREREIPTERNTERQKKEQRSVLSTIAFPRILNYLYIAWHAMSLMITVFITMFF